MYGLKPIPFTGIQDTGQILSTAMRMDCLRVLRGLVLCVWVRRVLVQWLRRTVIPGVDERSGRKQHEQQHR